MVDGNPLAVLHVRRVGWPIQLHRLAVEHEALLRHVSLPG